MKGKYKPETVVIETTGRCNLHCIFCGSDCRNIKNPNELSIKEWCDLNNIAYIEIEGSTRWGSDWKKQKETPNKSIPGIYINAPCGVGNGVVALNVHLCGVLD